MNITPMTIIQVEEDEGGYLVPEHIWTRRPGAKACLFRFVGRALKSDKLINKGMERHEFAKELEAIVKREKLISVKLNLSK